VVWNPSDLAPGPQQSRAIGKKEGKNEVDGELAVGEEKRRFVDQPLGISGGWESHADKLRVTEREF